VKVIEISSEYPVIDGVALPVNLERFIPPDLEDALKYYPDYLRHGGTQDIQPYLLCVVKAYAQYERQRGNTVDEDQILLSFFRHAGLSALFVLFQQGMDAKKAARAADDSQPRPSGASKVTNPSSESTGRVKP
jgi:CRISPR/Cas system endoribonuclease Cas6 (RAMP superfamily)